MTERSGAPVVAFVDADPNGLANLVGRLLEANLETHPERSRLLAPSVVELAATDADVSITVRLQRDRVQIANGSSGLGAHVSVEGHGQDLIDLAAAPLRLGLPDLLHGAGRSIVRRILGRDVRVSGMFRHPVRMSRFLRLLSVAR